MKCAYCEKVIDKGPYELFGSEFLHPGCYDRLGRDLDEAFPLNEGTEMSAELEPEADAEVSVKAVVIESDGNTYVKTIEGYNALRETIGCDMIEGISLGDDVFAYVDEEGKCKHPPAPLNSTATEFTVDLLTKIGRGLVPGDFIGGTMVIFGGGDKHGNDTDVPDRIVERLVKN